MATLDHVILKVNDLDASVHFYVHVMGFALEGREGPFTVIKAGRRASCSSRPGARRAWSTTRSP